MNCVDFRRIQNTEPNSTDPGFLAHPRECPACAALAQRGAQFEHKLRAALEVEVPEELSTRTVPKPSNHSRRRAIVPSNAWQAMAAGVLLVVGFAAGLLVPRGAPSLEDEVVRYVSSAPRHTAAPDPISQETLASLLEPVGAELRGSLGPVTSAHLCAISERVAAHIELPGERAPVVVLLIPGEQVAARKELDGGEWTGVLVPVHNGSLAIVGARGEPFTQVESRVRSAVTWRL
jgi:hypothetical protein